jgi:hypothetical protein
VVALPFQSCCPATQYICAPAMSSPQGLVSPEVTGLTRGSHPRDKGDSKGLVPGDPSKLLTDFKN